jgi:hypothetical protein
MLGEKDDAVASAITVYLVQMHVKILAPKVDVFMVVVKEPKPHPTEVICDLRYVGSIFAGKRKSYLVLTVRLRRVRLDPLGAGEAINFVVWNAEVG